jgi:ABC-type phosphate transport system ATPase subunit
VLDEAASGLDEAAARWLEETLVSLKGETSVVMVSHDADQVKRIADSVTVLG